MKLIDEKLANAKRAGIAGHVRPDGDCVGSALALYNYVRDSYPMMDVRLFLEPIPNIFRFLHRSEEIQNDFGEEPPFDVFFVVDCGDAGRLGAAEQYFNAARHTVCIDHHMSNQAFADDNYIVADASSTCELMFELMDEARITREIAECLYTGIVHDTGVFQYSCTSKKTMHIVGCLMEKGIDYPKIVDDTFYTKTFNQNRILGRALVDAELYLGGRCIVSTVTRAMMEEYEVLPKHLDGIVNQLRVTKGVEVAVFLYENEDGTFKGSLRVNGDVNVAEIAIAFGGGGHVKAAGFTIEGTKEDCIRRILAEVEKRLQ